jgi:hypothetical protein
MSDKRNTLTLALCIALFPPIWAVLAPYLHISVGPVALICAGLYVANGDRVADAPRISIGFLLGDLWAWLAVHILAVLPGNPDLALFATLFVLGGLAVLISAALPLFIFCPSWLCGWAIGLVILNTQPLADSTGYALQIAVAMLVGVWYVGAFVHAVQQALCKKGEKH